MHINLKFASLILISGSCNAITVDEILKSEPIVKNQADQVNIMLLSQLKNDIEAGNLGGLGKDEIIYEKNAAGKIVEVNSRLEKKEITFNYKPKNHVSLKKVDLALSNPETKYYSPCIYNCLNSLSIANNKNELIANANSIYFILKQSFGLNKKVKCSPYTANNYSYGLSVFNMGEVNPYLMYGDIIKDIYQQMLNVAYLSDSEQPESAKNGLIKSFKVKQQLIKNSCGAEFDYAFASFLNTYSKLWEAKISTDRKNIINAITTASNQKNELLIQKENLMNERISAQQESDRQLQKKKMESERCQKSTAYKIQLINNKIVNSNWIITDAMNTINKDKEAEKISGIVGVNLRYVAGLKIVNHKDIVSTLFKEYKSLGGTLGSTNQFKTIKNEITCF